MVTFVMIPAGVLLYRDDTGQTVAEKLAQRARIFAGRPALGMFVVMFVIINLAYFAYGTGFAIIKWTRTATSVACPWPYPEAKVYDPQGFYEENGQAGPVLRWHLVDLDERPARRAAGCAARAPRATGAHRRTRMAETRSVVITGASRGPRVRVGGPLVQAGVAGCRGDAVGRRGHGEAARGGRCGCRRSAA